jgi:hypothetical protein
MDTLPYIKADLPPGRVGEWSLERFAVQGEPHFDPTTHDAPDCARRRPGTYTRLKRGDTVFMTDLYDEWFTQKIAIDQALERGGHVLISGLGLGLILDSILQSPESSVERITLLELSPEVIALVGQHLLERYPERLEILEADVFTWQPPTDIHYSVVWHDIWPNPQAPETLAEMETLEARYLSLCDWHGCWPREYRWIYEGLPWDRGVA